ncbi:MAG: IS66 family insertion sequence element accessory protein TnpB [Sandaracinaceae bacterium]|nr:IS66 family insertion sequence element accessory protein TnpB [Sandaracinaceae bacterium]
MMFGTSRSVRVWARTAPTDLRKGYNGLYGLVKNELGRDPLSGDLHLFVNRQRTSCKVLMWDGTGLCIFMKRLERGRFALLRRDPESGAVRLSASELALFIEGCDLVGRQALTPEPLTPMAASPAM